MPRSEAGSTRARPRGRRADQRLYPPRHANASCAPPSKAPASAARRSPPITKSNALGFSMVLWDEVFNAVGKDYPDVQTNSLLVDAAAMDFVRKPESFRRRRRQQSVRRHPHGPERDRYRQHGAGRERRTSTRSARPEHVRAGARLGAGHRGQGDRQPAGGDSVGRNAAGTPRPGQGGGTPFATRSPPCSRQASRALRTLAATKKPEPSAKRY